jgi:acylphosphatase
MVGIALDRRARHRRGRRGVSDRVIRHIVVRGRVQGVGYRAFVEDEARQRCLQGWVRNRRDGSVEAVFAGPAAEVDAAIDACRRGPLSARVSALDQREGTEVDLSERSGNFSVLPTV